MKDCGAVGLREHRLREVPTGLAGIDVEGCNEFYVTRNVGPQLRKWHADGGRALGAAIVNALNKRTGAVTNAYYGSTDQETPCNKIFEFDLSPHLSQFAWHYKLFGGQFVCCSARPNPPSAKRSRTCLRLSEGDFRAPACVPVPPWSGRGSRGARRLYRY